jgi:predicted nucleotidyltransferase
MKNKHGFTIEQRDDIFKTFDIKKEISSFFNISIDSDEPQTHHINLTHSIQYNETDKFGILFSSKAGSTAIGNVLTENKLNLFDFYDGNDLVSEFKEYIKFGNGYKDKWEFDEFFKILNGKSKKDLIVVIRNPIYKFLSGIYQDISLEIKHSQLLFNIIKEKYKLDNIYQNRIDFLSDEAIGELSFMYINNLFETIGTIRYGHVNPINETFFNVLYISKNINKSKIKIIDIDNPNYVLFDVLKQYYPDIKETVRIKNFWTHRSKHKIILDGIDKHIDIQNKQHLKQWIRQQVSQDYHYYKILKQDYTEYEPK